jgi:hypothetical protein
MHQQAIQYGAVAYYSTTGPLVFGLLGSYAPILVSLPKITLNPTH